MHQRGHSQILRVGTVEESTQRGSAVETGKVEASKDVKALMKHVRKCFETEDIYVDQQQLTDYLGLARYFPYDEVFRGSSS